MSVNLTNLNYLNPQAKNGINNLVHSDVKEACVNTTYGYSLSAKKIKSLNDSSLDFPYLEHIWFIVSNAFKHILPFTNSVWQNSTKTLTNKITKLTKHSAPELQTYAKRISEVILTYYLNLEKNTLPDSYSREGLRKFVFDQVFTADEKSLRKANFDDLINNLIRADQLNAFNVNGSSADDANAYNSDNFGLTAGAAFRAAGAPEDDDSDAGESDCFDISRSPALPRPNPNHTQLEQKSGQTLDETPPVEKNKHPTTPEQNDTSNETNQANPHVIIDMTNTFLEEGLKVSTSKDDDTPEVNNQANSDAIIDMSNAFSEEGHEVITSKDDDTPEVNNQANSDAIIDMTNAFPEENIEDNSPKKNDNQIINTVTKGVISAAAWFSKKLFSDPVNQSINPNIENQASQNHSSSN